MIFDRFLSFIRGEGGVENYIGMACPNGDIGRGNRIVEYTYALCVQTVANLVARCDKETMVRGERDEGTWHYQLNLSPNRNQSATNFWRELVHKLFYGDGEALIIRVAGGLYIADSYTKDEKVFTDNIYRDIYVQGQLVRSQRTFKEHEVFRISLDHFLGYSAADAGSFYDHILNTVAKQYLKKKYNKPVFEVPGINPLKAGRGESNAPEVIKKQVKEFVDKEGDAVLVTDGGINVGKYESVMGEGYNDDGPNIINFSNELSQQVAKMFHLPIEALRGEDVSLNTHINLFLRPLLNIIENELNRKYYSRANYKAGSKVKIRGANIENISAMEKAQTNDYKLRSGIYNINEIRREEGLEVIDEPWATKHFMTLNYDVIDKFITGEQGSGANKNSPVEEKGGEDEGEDRDISK